MYPPSNPSFSKGSERTAVMLQTPENILRPTRIIENPESRTLPYGSKYLIIIYSSEYQPTKLLSATQVHDYEVLWTLRVVSLNPKP